MNLKFSNFKSVVIIGSHPVLHKTDLARASLLSWYFSQFNRNLAIFYGFVLSGALLKCSKPCLLKSHGLSVLVWKPHIITRQYTNHPKWLWFLFLQAFTRSSLFHITYHTCRSRKWYICSIWQKQWSKNCTSAPTS